MNMECQQSREASGQKDEFMTSGGPSKSEAQIRKDRPVFSGVLRYFPDALLEVAELSRIGNEQHNPGQPLHWARSKSTDHNDALLRHLIDTGTRDSDGVRHAAKVAWRALAQLQTEIENERYLYEREAKAEDFFADVALASGTNITQWATETEAAEWKPLVDGSAQAAVEGVDHEPEHDPSISYRFTHEDTPNYRSVEGQKRPFHSIR